MSKPNYIINVAIADNKTVISYPLGAAWKTQNGNHRMRLTYYSVPPSALVYLHRNSKPNGNHSSALLQYLSHRRDKDIVTHRVFSAKKIKEARPWFQTHGDIVLAKLDDTDLLVMRLATLPYPDASTALFFTPIEKHYPPIYKGENVAPFAESVCELNADDYI